MNISILADKKDSFVKPIAEGLSRMSRDCGANPTIVYDAHEILSLPLDICDLKPKTVARHILKGGRYRKRFFGLVERLSEASVIVVVAHIPSSLSKRLFGNVELLREALPLTPIVNYDLVYLPVVDKWSDVILRGETTGLSAKEKHLVSPPPSD